MREADACFKTSSHVNPSNASKSRLALAMLLRRRAALLPTDVGEELWVMKGAYAILLLAVVLVLSLPVVGPRLPVLGAWMNYYLLTKRFVPIKKIETLHNAIAVTGWSSNGLNLAGGRIVQLPGIHSLPSESEALAEATKRGVEVGVDGRIWGLVRIHHWCGNDPAREHIARIDLSDMMIFLRVGEPIALVPQSESLLTQPGGAFTEFGWRVGEFYQFQAWQSAKNLDR